jgi:PAS domain S-box-containing protein
MKSPRDRLANDLAIMQMLHEISTRFIQEDDPKALFEQIVNAALDIVGAEMGNIQVLDESSGRLKIAACCSRGMSLPACCCQADKSLAACGIAMQRADRLVVGDVATSPALAGTPWRDALLAAGVRALQATPLFTRAGKMVGMLSTHSRQAGLPADSDLRLLDMLARQIADIIERSLANKALQESVLRRRSLFDNMLEGCAHCRMIFVDGQPVDFVYLDVNPAFTRLTGMRDVVGRRVSEVLPGIHEENPEIFRIYGEVASTGEPARFETYVAALGFWSSIAVYCPAEGEFVAVFDNITERKRSAAELQVREERLRLAKRAAGLGLYDEDVLTNTFQWDERVRELWGVEADETITFETFMMGVHPDDRAATQAALDRAFEPSGSGQFYAEYRVINRADGRERHVASTGQVYCDNGQAVRRIGMVRDITERKRLEKELQARRGEMEALLQHQIATQTAAAIAHDLNQPLVAISAYSEVALRALQSGRDDPQRLTRALEGCVEQAQRAGRTLHELLDFLHHGDTVSLPMDLGDTVRETIALVEESGYGGFHIVLDLEGSLPPVLGNRIQIQKVLDNLLHNAIDAMHENGQANPAITIRVHMSLGRQQAQVTVQDNGPGLDAELARRVFEPFFTTKANGIGLGLAISRALIEAHGGVLWADLDDGSGAVFHFTLPLVP